MHEFSLMSQAVQSMLSELAKHRVVKVEEVIVQVGELTFLSNDAMTFSYEILTQDTILKNSKFTIEPRHAEVRCDQCGFEGKPNYSCDAYDHFSVPILACPECKGEVTIIAGREFVIRSIRFEEAAEEAGIQESTG